MTKKSAELSAADGISSSWARTAKAFAFAALRLFPSGIESNPSITILLLSTGFERRENKKI
jgi:hypothetical protein